MTQRKIILFLTTAPFGFEFSPGGRALPGPDGFPAPQLPDMKTLRQRWKRAAGPAVLEQECPLQQA
jgi:hypothetical protein